MSQIIISPAKLAMQWITKLAKKGVSLGALKASNQRRRHFLLGYEKLDSPALKPAPVGHLPVYVGEERQRFVIPMAFLSHPLFSILLERAYQEYGFRHSHGLRLPCHVSVFMDVISAVEKFHGQFDLEKLTEKHW